MNLETEHKMYRSEYIMWKWLNKLVEVHVERLYVCGCVVIFDCDEKTSLKTTGRYVMCIKNTQADWVSCARDTWIATNIRYACGCMIRRHTITYALIKFNYTRCRIHRGLKVYTDCQCDLCI